MCEKTQKALDEVAAITAQQDNGLDLFRNRAQWLGLEATFGAGQLEEARRILPTKAAELGIPDDPVIISAVQEISRIQPMW